MASLASKPDGVNIIKDSNLIPFLFMGCWNRDDTPRSSVAKAIIDNPIKTLILGGDNVYPEKIKIGNSLDFTKIYSLKTLMDGVHMLQGKEIYAALGNHNVSEPILKTQLSLPEWTLPSRYYSVDFLDYSLIVIDTSLIDTDMFDVMVGWLSKKVKALHELSKKYYYVQHDPFMSFKKHKQTLLPKINELFNILSSYPPTAILCADTHNFQTGTLNVNGVSIPQYVVGTGGADPDYVKAAIGSSFHSKPDNIHNIIYTMDTYIPGYGYLQIDNNETTFIKVENWRSYEGKGGRRHKTHKKKIRRFKKSRKLRKLKH